MNFNTLNSLKVKIVLIFSLLMAVAFGLNWQVAIQTIHDEKVEDVEKVLAHLLTESKDEYIFIPLNPSSDLRFLHTIPHNILILKDSEASHVRFLVQRIPYKPNKGEVSTSLALDNGFYLNAISDHHKIDAAVAKYGEKLLVRYLLSLLVILIISFWLLHRYMRPLGGLAERTRRWKSGDPFEFSTSNAGEEIDELSRAFSALVRRLEGFRSKEKALFKEMAHELKTPIALMRARLDVYENSHEFSKEKMLGELGHDIQRLMSELKNVLFFESSDFEDPQTFQIADALNEVIAKVDILAQRRNLTIRLTPESFPLNVPRTIFLKVIRALIENALTYAKEKSDIVIEVNPLAKTLTIVNEKGGEKYLFSSKIGQKMLDRVSREVGIGYRIEDDERWYRVEVTVLTG